MKRATWLTICFLLLRATVFAQSLDGDWTINLRDRVGQPIMLTLKSDGSKLTGTMHAFRTIPLEGLIEGNVLRIRLRVPTATGGELLVNYTAISEGDELKFTHQSDNGRPPPFGPAAREFTARRVK